MSALAEQWKELPLLWAFGIAFLIQLSIYVVVAGGVSSFYGGMLHGFKRGALIDPRPLRPRQIRTEIGWSLMTCGVYAGFTLIAMQIASEEGPPSWFMVFIQLGAMFIYYDFLTYWSHRLLHTRRLRAFHGVHHHSIRATTWSVYCMHPVEAAINQLQILSFMLIWPTSIGVVLFFQFEVMLGGAIGHSNFDPFGSTRWQALPKLFHRFHQRHHSFGRDNFGFAGPHWDMVFGTAEPRLP